MQLVQIGNKIHCSKFIVHSLWFYVAKWGKVGKIGKSG